MKKIALLAIAALLTTLAFSGCLSDKGKFIGTWQFSDGGTITFFNNDTVTIQTVHPMVVFQLNSVFTYALSGNNVTFTSRGSPIAVTITFTYNFPNATPLYVQPQALIASWIGFLISPVANLYL